MTQSTVFFVIKVLINRCSRSRSWPTYSEVSVGSFPWICLDRPEGGWFSYPGLEQLDSQPSGVPRMTGVVSNDEEELELLLDLAAGSCPWLKPDSALGLCRPQYESEVLGGLVFRGCKGSIQVDRLSPKEEADNSEEQSRFHSGEPARCLWLWQAKSGKWCVSSVMEDIWEV